MDRPKRIALYGGTFDPVHVGHLEVARKAVELFELDELLFVPAGHAPHKLEREVTSSLHRYAMLTLATQLDPRLSISRIELEDPSRRYTIETLRHFRSVLDVSAKMFFLMGADSWNELTTWREWQAILQSVNLIVVTRPGSEISKRELPIEGLSVVNAQGMGKKEITEALFSSPGPTVYLTDIAMVDVSASAIREVVRSGRDNQLQEMVAAPVADYIKKYRLYKNSNEN